MPGTSWKEKERKPSSVPHTETRRLPSLLQSKNAIEKEKGELGVGGWRGEDGWEVDVHIQMVLENKLSSFEFFSPKVGHLIL